MSPYFRTLFCVMMIMPIMAFALDHNSKQVLLIDLTTNTVLYEKDADLSVPPSSMTKLMTAYLAFEELKSGRILGETKFIASEKAWKKGGTKMFVPLGQAISITDLLRGIIVVSGNDASIVLAEGLSGSEEAFAELMTRRAHELGANQTNFVNATGWPDPNHYSTMRDLVLIARKTIENFPEYYSYYKELEFTYNNIRQMNRNPLLYNNTNCDGLKTGHTDAGGFGLVASAVQENRRIILAINGAASMKLRADDAKALLGWGFTYFASPKIFSAHQIIEQADVWIGRDKKVDLQVDHDLYVTLPRHRLKEMKVEIVYHNPLAAPLVAGQTVGKIVVTAPEMKAIEIPLKTAQAVDKAGFFDRIKAAVSYLVRGRN